MKFEKPFVRSLALVPLIVHGAASAWTEEEVPIVEQAARAARGAIAEHSAELVDRPSYNPGEKSAQSAEKLTALAATLVAKGNLRQAAHAYETAIALDPNYKPASLGYADLLVTLTRYKDAIDAVHAALRKWPSEGEFLRIRGDAYFHDEKFEEAIDSYQSALELLPADAAFLNERMAMAQVASGRFEAARATAQQISPAGSNKSTPSTRPCVVCDEEVPDLLVRLASADRPIREAAARELGANFSPVARIALKNYAQQFILELHETLKTGRPEAQHGAMFILHALGAEAAPVLPELERFVLGANEELARSAIILSRSIGQAAQSLTPIFANILNGSRKGCRRCVASALGLIGGEQAIPALIGVLGDSDASIRQTACESLGLLGAGSAEAIASLRPKLEDSDPNVREAAAAALARMVETPLERHN